MSGTRPRTSRQVAAFVIVFFSGMVVGWAVTLVTLPARPGSPDDLTQQVLPWLKSQLALNSQQSEKIERILQERHQALQEIRSQTGEAVRLEFDRLEAQVSEVLSEDQQPRWQQMLTQLRKRWLPETKQANSAADREP